MGDWTVSIGGSGANSGVASSQAAPTAANLANNKLFLIGLIVLGILWINKQ